MKRCLRCHNEFAGESWTCPSCGFAPSADDGLMLFAPELASENAGFSEGYFAELAKREKGHFWFEARNELLIWALGRYFPDAKSFLEIGCGTGFVLSGLHEAYPSLDLWGSEIFVEGLRFAAARLSNLSPHANSSSVHRSPFTVHRLLQMDARRIPFIEEYDVIGAFDVLEHIEEDESVLAEMFRAVVPGGGILITVPQHRWLWSSVDEYSFHKRRYSRRELVDQVRKAGFRVIRITSFVSSVLPLMLASRWRKRKNKPEPLSEFELSKTVNAALLKTLRMENVLIRSGLSFPAGGSLLLVASKPK